MEKYICGNCPKKFNGRVNSYGESTKITARGCMEVYLTDDSGTLPATLFSLLFEKRTEITPDQLYEADNKEISVLPEIAQAIDGIPVVCFVKYYDKKFMGSTMRNFPIVKLYKVDDAAVSVDVVEKVQERPHVHASCAAANAQADDPSRQFFSPTTKQIMDQIARICSYSLFHALPDYKEAY